MMGFYARSCLTAALVLCACRREESDQRQGQAKAGASPSAIDANGDGIPDLLGSEYRLLQRLNDKFGLALDLAPPVFACGC